MKKKLVPELRFPEFSGEWEEKKLGEMLDERNDQIPENEEYPLMSFVQGIGVTPKSARYDRSFLVRDEQKKYKKTERDDFIYSSNNLETGSIGLNKTGKAVISPVYSIFSSKNELESKFVGIMAQRKEFIAKMIRYRQGVVYGQWRIHESDFLNIKVRVPSHEEQEKIANFFFLLDKKIEKQEEKIASIEDYKRGMMQKLFPKKGENIPELRFKGFTDPWEQRKVGDYYDFKNGLNKGKEFFGKGTPIVNFTDVFHNREIYHKNLSGKVSLEPSEIRNYGVKKGDIFFTRTSETIEEIGYPSVMLDAPKDTVFSGFVLRGRTKLNEDPLDNLFKKYVFFTNVFRAEMIKKSSMTTRALTSGTAIRNMTFMHPINKAEQEKIGTFFTNIDNLITLHQRKLEELKELKRGFMQKMFI